MNIKKYLSALLLIALFITAYQNAEIIGDVVNDTENIASNALTGAEDITNDVVNDTEDVVNDVVYDDNNNDNNDRYYRNYMAQDIVYTPPVAVDKAVHPINSIKHPFRTAGDILPIQTFDDYREDYEYRS